jgi:benzoylformate decarboxylase
MNQPETVTCASSCYEILRRHGMTTIFGNPGSNELPFLAEMPADFRYVLGLHEGVVVGMADGYAPASDRPVLVNLHAGSGTGNAMGALTNAWYSHSPLVVTAGQQARELVGLEAMLANVDAPLLPRPLVKWSHEPLLAADVPRSLSQAILSASSPPQGPTYLSVPHDDWQRPVPRNAARLPDRTVDVQGSPSAAVVAELASTLTGAQAPLIVLGPEVDAARANRLAVDLAERLGAPVWVAPSAPRCPFPTVHPAFRGLLPMSVADVASVFAGHDVVLVVGGPVFRYHQHRPASYLPDGTQLVHMTGDVGEAARAPVGRSYVVDIAAALGALVDVLPERRDSLNDAPPAVEDRISRGGPSRPTGVQPWGDAVALDAILGELPEHAVIVNEATSLVSEVWDRMRVTLPGSYYFAASGGLGFGMAAAVGIQMADPRRPVVALIGDGSANYGITALWTAAQLQVPVVFVVLVNGAYRALDGFSEVMGLGEVAGTRLGGIDFLAIAAGYGVEGIRVHDAAALEIAFREGCLRDVPVLIEVDLVGS